MEYTLSTAIKAIIDLEQESGVAYIKSGIVVTFKTAESDTNGAPVWLAYQFTREVSDVNPDDLKPWVAFGNGGGKVETSDTIPAGRTRFALCYGSDDRTIPIADQQCAREQLGSTGRCTYFEYPGMAHNICDQEIADVRAWLGL